MTSELNEFSVAKLELAPGDVLVVKGPLPSGTQTSTLSRIVPRGVRILYIPENVELSVLTKAEIDSKCV